MIKHSIISLLLVFLSTVAVMRAETIRVQTSGGEEYVRSAKHGEAPYYSLSQLTSILGGSISWLRTGYSVKYVFEKHTYLFEVESPYLRYNDSLCSMIYPAKIIDGALFVPAQTYTPLLNLSRSENITWDHDSRILRIDSEWFNVTGLNILTKKNGILLEIYMNSPMRVEIYQSEGNWLNIDIPEGRIDRAKVLAGIERSAVYKVNAFQFEASAQISIRMKRSFKRWHHSFKTEPNRLQISLEDENYIPDSVFTSISQIGPDGKIDIIVIDPGHGGKDYGAIGRDRGTREKDVNLAIAKHLAREIRKDKQFKVIMTRARDEYVSLDDRAKIANDAKADLFVSIHANSSPKRSANGHQVFYLAPAKSDAARAVAQFENAPFLLDNAEIDDNQQDDLAFILNDMIQTEFITESADLAYMADMELRKRIKIRPRGVDHAGFFVLNRVYMPSILVEAAFISNADEERLLRDKDFARDVAEAIYEAIKRFKAKYERI